MDYLGFTYTAHTDLDSRCTVIGDQFGNEFSFSIGWMPGRPAGCESEVMAMVHRVRLWLDVCQRAQGVNVL